MFTEMIKFYFFVLGLSIILFWVITNPHPWWEIILQINSRKLSGLSLIIYIVLLQILFFDFPVIKTDPPGFVQILGILLGTAGTLLAIWAKFVMNKSWGLPGQHNQYSQNKIVTSGPFKITRNPIYVGLLFFLFGYELSQLSLFMLLIIPSLWLINRAIIREEKLLLKIFGNKYAEYFNSVPRYLF